MTRGSVARSARVADSMPFLVLPESQLAFAAASQLREARGSRPCPLLTISGPAGCGKSHLVTQVFAGERLAAKPAQLIEVTAEEFVNEWHEAVRSRSVAEMRELYESHQILVCEDLQGFAGSPAAQEAFVSLLDEVIAGGGRVVVTCVAPPQEVRGLTQRLVSRCHGGVSVSIPLPGRASRLKLLRHFAAPLQIPVALEALELISGNEGCSPRELLGVLRGLAQAAEQRRQSVTADLVRELHAAEPHREKRQIADVAREVARQFGVTLRELRSQSRVTPTRVPRQAAMFLSRELTSARCSEIGAYFNGRTHSTVVYACEQFERQLAEDPRLLARMDQIRQALSRSGPSRRRKPVDKRTIPRRATG